MSYTSNLIAQFVTSFSCLDLSIPCVILKSPPVVSNYIACFLCVFSSLYITQVVCFHYTVFKVLSPLSRGDSVILSLLFPFVNPFFKVFSDFFVYNPVQPNMLYYRAPYIVRKYEYQHKLCRYLRLLREASLYARFPAAYFIKNKSCGEVIHIKLCC